MSHFVGHGDVGDGGRDVLAVVQQGHNPRVQTLQTATIMLEKMKEKDDMS